MKVIYILSCFILVFSTVSEAKIFDSSLKKPLLMKLMKNYISYYQTLKNQPCRGIFLNFMNKLIKYCLI